MSESSRLSQVLEGYDVPAILVSADYEILATNRNYTEKFGAIALEEKPNCFAVSHGYDRPCDQAGEDCPLLAAKESARKERVLHIHQTPNGSEHVDVEMIPILDDNQELQFFVELLKPVPLASGQSKDRKVVGDSPAFKKLLKTATQAAQSDANILLLGESGTGKELISNIIHFASRRSDKPLVTLECAGLSETLIESELFGHKKGSFTGAHNDKIGLVEHADGGTLFLDEIGDVSPQTQVKLLRLIETRTFRRVGGTEMRTSDFRLICATHRNLAEMVEEDKFRLDLYYRINVFPIQLPALRDRIEDIPRLVEHMLKDNPVRIHVTASAMELLQAREFRGNIRELRNLIERAVVLCETNVIDVAVIRNAMALDDISSSSEQPQRESGHISLRDHERRYITQLMRDFSGDKERVAEVAGVSLRTLYRKLDAKG